jgi:hypothetical protein
MNMREREKALEDVKRDGLNLEFISDELKNDREIVLAAVKQNPEALRCADISLQDDPEFTANK